jgi:hypothetical protein
MDGPIFNKHTGAACGLIIGIILGSLTLDLRDGGTGSGPRTAAGPAQPVPSAVALDAAVSASSQR